MAQLIASYCAPRRFKKNEAFLWRVLMVLVVIKATYFQYIHWSGIFGKFITISFGSHKIESNLVAEMTNRYAMKM